MDTPAPSEPEPPATASATPSRRSFIRGLGVAAAGAAGIGLGGVAVYNWLTPVTVRTFPPPTASPAQAFEHLIVVMFENRSFDNILGWLYPPNEVPAGARFAGLHQGTYSNPVPGGSEVVPAHVYSGPTDRIMSSPIPDPGEAYPHVNTQLFGTVDPPSNADLTANRMSAPYNAPPKGATPTMAGFVQDYITNFQRLSGGVPPAPDEYAVAMGGFSPDMLPVFSTLAKNFAVFDHWYAAVPSQTFCNRSFFHASTSNGFVTNRGGGDYGKWFDGAVSAPTIFNRLQDEGLSWRVYYDAAQLVSLTGVLHANATQKYWKTNFRTMEQFYLDVANGTLPSYAFIEPRMIFNHNDMHPPYGDLRVGSNGEGATVTNAAVSDVRAGEQLLHELYTALRTAASPTGSNTTNTSMLITFDEHGGTYDHVPPPSAVPPGTGETSEMGFSFDRLGCRVPAVLISAWTAPNTILNDPKHHSSLVSTLSRQHGLSPLTARDVAAPNMFDAINLTTPRSGAQWPQTTPADVPIDNDGELDPKAEANKTKKLSNPAQGLLGLLIAKFGDPSAPVPDSYEDAYDALTELGGGLFGTTDPA